MDEIRLDSHEKRGGARRVAPHFHLKLATAFKHDPAAGVEQIKSVMDNYLDKMSGEIG